MRKKTIKIILMIAVMFLFGLVFSQEAYAEFIASGSTKVETSYGTDTDAMAVEAYKHNLSTRNGDKTMWRLNC